jgi:hypothetical protein
MAETGDGTQGLAKTSPPVSNPLFPQGGRGSLGILMAETGDGTQGLAKTSPPVSNPLFPQGGRGSLGILKPETYEGQEYKPVFALAVGLMEIEHYSGSHRG